MYSWVHLLTGILIQSFIFAGHRPTEPLWVLVCILAFLSHFLLDLIGNFTFHPEKSAWREWPAQQIIVNLLAIAIFVYFFAIYPPYAHFEVIPYISQGQNMAVVMFWSNLPDIIDWVIVRGLIKIKLVPHRYWDYGFMHLPNRWLRTKMGSHFIKAQKERKWFLIEFIFAVICTLGLILLIT